ncbi:MAG: TIGR02302 family protein [Rhizobiaceae bacterium]
MSNSRDSGVTARQPDSGSMPPLHVRALAHAAISWERLFPLLVPFLMIVTALAIVSWFGIWRRMPLPAHLALAALFVVGAVSSLRRIIGFRLPAGTDIIRRIERATGLENRPISAQVDAMATGREDEFSRVLWREHQKRMAEGLDELSAGMARPDANRHDPHALRAALAILAFVAFGFSYGSNGGRLGDLFNPGEYRRAAPVRLDAWINPPPYTRKPPVYLDSANASVADSKTIEDSDAGRQWSVPVGSTLSVRVVGLRDPRLVVTSEAGEEEIAPETGKDIKEPNETSAKEPVFKLVLSEDSSVTLLSAGKVHSTWSIATIPDIAPQIAFEEKPSGALSGSLQLSYRVEDDYGVVSAEAEISSEGRTDPSARPLVEAPKVPLPLPRQRARDGKAKANRDLSSHPLAGSKVVIRLHAKDDAGQIGTSEPISMVLPGRRFSNPLALALLEQRRILALDANKQGRVGDLLDAVLTAPEEFIGNAGIFMTLKAGYRRLVDARDDDQLRSVLDLLWETALAVEFGDMSEAERKLREAQEALSKALEDGASDEEVARLMDELRKAMDELMRMLAEQALQNQQMANPLNQNDMSTMLRQRDLERMLDRIEDLAKSGSRDAARELLSEMQRMMDNLRAGRHQQQRQAEGNRTNQALDKLSELMRRQQELMDETFSMQRKDPSNRQNNGEQQQEQQRSQGNRQGEQQQGPGGDQPMSAEEFAEAMKKLQEQQEALQQELGELGEQMRGLGLDPSEAFGEAGTEMGEAGENLGEARPGDAAGNQGQALEALRRGAQQMMQQMAGDRQQGGQQPGEAGMAGRDRNRPDPLGRRDGAEGFESGDNTRIPGEIEAQRAREIMEAIRKRLSQPLSPRLEKDYLQRLLETDR